jgi:hypothetical protein
MLTTEQHPVQSAAGRRCPSHHHPTSPESVTKPTTPTSPYTSTSSGPSCATVKPQARAVPESRATSPSAAHTCKSQSHRGHCASARAEGHHALAHCPAHARASSPQSNRLQPRTSHPFEAASPVGGSAFSASNRRTASFSGIAEAQTALLAQTPGRRSPPAEPRDFSLSCSRPHTAITTAPHRRH